MLRTIIILLLTVMITGLCAAEEVYTYHLKDGRSITGLASESIAGKPVRIKIWFKDRFMGQMEVAAADVVSKEPYKAKKAVIITKKKHVPQHAPELYYITLKDDRVITGTISKLRRGKVNIKTWFKGRFMAEMSVSEHDIVSKEKVPANEVAIKEEKSVQQEVAEEVATEEFKDKKCREAAEKADEKIARMRGVRRQKSRIVSQIASLDNSNENNQTQERSLKSIGRWTETIYVTNLAGKQVRRTQKTASAKSVESRKRSLDKTKDELKDQVKDVMRDYRNAMHYLEEHREVCERYERPVASKYKLAEQQYEREYDELKSEKKKLSRIRIK